MCFVFLPAALGSCGGCRGASGCFTFPRVFDRGDPGRRRLYECWWWQEPGHVAPLFRRWWLQEPGHFAPLLVDMSAGAATAAAAAAQAAQAVLDTSESYRRSDVLRTLIQKPDIFRPETVMLESQNAACKFHIASQAAHLGLVAGFFFGRFGQTCFFERCGQAFFQCDLRLTIGEVPFAGFRVCSKL